MKFDRSDLPFVAVAFQSKDKLLVSEDSDYTQKVVTTCSSNFGSRFCRYHKRSNLRRTLKTLEGRMRVG